MQTWALLVDSYRLLLSRKLFWITLVISGLVVLMYASIGFDDRGWYLFFGATHFDDNFLKKGTTAAEKMYLGIFSDLIVGWWFTWIATILALVSTASVYTDMMSSGSIDLLVAKPLSRMKLFFVKYLGSLMFVAIQIALFSLGVFLCVGVRVEQWNWKIFLSIPIVVLFFSYLYAVHVCLSIMTRSTLASLLLTIMFWAVIAVVQWAEKGLAVQKVMQRYAAEHVEEMDAQSQPRVTNGGVDLRRSAKSKQETPEEREKRLERNRKEYLERAESFETWQRRVQYVLAVFPKTQDTVGLLNKWILPKTDDVLEEQRRIRGRQSGNPGTLQKKLEEEFVDRSTTYILGTSLAFEAVVLAFACFLFYRRDF